MQLEPITAEHFPFIYATFLVDDDHRLTESDWRRMFLYPWKQPHDEYGYVLMDGQQLVGVIGTIFSERIVGESSHRVCNLHSWFVKPEYRGRSLLLLRPVLRMKDVTLTDFTPTPAVVAISMRLGFQPINNTLKILMPVRTFQVKDAITLEVLSNPALAYQRLNRSDFMIYYNHMTYDCNHVYCESDTDSCYILFSRVTRTAVPYGYLRYVSNKPFFLKHHALIRQYLQKRCRTRFLAVDARHYPQKSLPLSFEVPVHANALIRPVDLQPGDIDNLYSEATLLNLTSIPGLRSYFRISFNKKRSTILPRGKP